MSVARAETAVRRPPRVERPAQPERRRPRPKLRAVASRPPRRRRWPFLVLSAVLVGGLLVAVVAAQALVAQNSFREQDLQKRTVQLQQAYAALRLEVAQDSGPGRIAQEAGTLGLTLPNPNDVYTLPIADPTADGAGSSMPSFPLRPPLGGHP